MNVISIIQKVILQIRIKRVQVHPIQVCIIVRDVLRKYGHDVNIKKGYLIIENLSCFTYFWLEDDGGTKYDVLKIPDPPFAYTLSYTMPDDATCVDKADTSIQDLNILMWNRVDTTEFFTRELEGIRKSILKKHPHK
jgi:hypothetical protein